MPRAALMRPAISDVTKISLYAATTCGCVTTAQNLAGDRDDALKKQPPSGMITSTSK